MAAERRSDMGSWTKASSHIDPDDRVRVNHYAEKPAEHPGGSPIPESLHVSLGDVDIWGPPDRVLTILDEALTDAQSAMDDREEAESW